MSGGRQAFTDPKGTACSWGIKLSLGGQVDLLRMRTREGMSGARTKGKLRGKKPKLSPKQRVELWRMHATGDYTIADLIA